MRKVRPSKTASARKLTPTQRVVADLKMQLLKAKKDCTEWDIDTARHLANLRKLAGLPPAEYQTTGQPPRPQPAPTAAL